MQLSLYKKKLIKSLINKKAWIFVFMNSFFFTKKQKIFSKKKNNYYYN